MVLDAMAVGPRPYGVEKIVYRDEIREAFTYKAPTAAQAEAINTVLANFRALALLIEAMPMDPFYQARVVEKLEEASLWANKGIVFSPNSVGE